MARTMKDSGIEWIGEIPEEWGTPKIVNQFDIIGSGTTPKSNEDEYYEDGTIYWIQSGDLHNLFLKGTNKRITLKAFENASALKLYEPDYLVVAMYGASIGNISISKIRACTNQACCVLADGKNILKYMYYVISSAKDYLIYQALGGTQPNISQNFIRDLRTPLPNLDEQRKIADYLDDKIVEIDVIISKTKECIESYKKYKQAVITEIITQGLDKAVDVVDTDNIHIPKIPAHWQMKKMKYIFEIKKDIAGKEGYDILSITQKGIKIKDVSKNEGQLAQDYSNYQLVDIGDFAMNHMDLLTGWVDISKYAGVTSPDYRVFKFIDATEYDADYYLYLMQMCYMNRIFYGLGQGVSNLGRWRLQAEKFLNFSIPEPPLKEQQEIAKYLSARCTEIDALIAKKEAFVEEMEAYKKSLIYEYVTGKKKVPVC